MVPEGWPASWNWRPDVVDAAGAAGTAKSKQSDFEPRIMKVALVNPNWRFEGSIYFGCREPHLPLEYAYAAALLARAGHQATLIDAQLEDLDDAALRARVAAVMPDMTVVTTAPSYLFWRCAPPELRVPAETWRALDGITGVRVVVGPHASTTPRA